MQIRCRYKKNEKINPLKFEPTDRSEMQGNTRTIQKIIAVNHSFLCDVISYAALEFLKMLFYWMCNDDSTAAKNPLIAESGFVLSIALISNSCVFNFKSYASFFCFCICLVYLSINLYI